MGKTAMLFQTKLTKLPTSRALSFLGTQWSKVIITSVPLERYELNLGASAALGRILPRSWVFPAALRKNPIVAGGL